MTDDIDAHDWRNGCLQPPRVPSGPRGADQERGRTDGRIGPGWPLVLLLVDSVVPFSAGPMSPKKKGKKKNDDDDIVEKEIVVPVRTERVGYVWQL